MNVNTLTALSPIDGRYADQVNNLRIIFSEFGLIKRRVIIEIRWLQFLNKNPDITEVTFGDKANKLLENIIANFDLTQAAQVKEIEKTTKHDVKAVEYFIKKIIAENDELTEVQEFIHFACTSEDINNLSYALMLKDAKKELLKYYVDIIDSIRNLALSNKKAAMVARTHGQVASPTTMGKEMANFVSRLKKQQQSLENVAIMGKFNGAVGNFNAHLSAYPQINWQQLSQQFIESFDIVHNKYTTQIEPHDHIAEYLHTISRYNNILIDFCRDIWNYISLSYFSQKIINSEIGSSTMPHKVNPINFENAEGNLGIANAINNHLADKLLISRLQRDLTDSTVLRNLGTAIAHSQIAYIAILAGMTKLSTNKDAMQEDLNNHWEILAEPIQTVMRRFNIKKGYEKLKYLTRGQKITKQVISDFINDLNIPDNSKQYLLNLTPDSYVGDAINLVEDL